MFKQKVTIWLVGLICFSSAGGFSKVICCGSDGHIALEPVFHKHCECPKPDETSSQCRLSGPIIESMPGHGHCTDTVAISGVIISVRKNIKSSTDKLIATKITSKTTSLYCPTLLSHFLARGSKLSSFHEPLRTVILLT